MADGETVLFDKDFRYKHANPYHLNLGEFPFVLRDHQGESFAGRWNQKVFGRQAPLAVEIGSGFGHFMLDYCKDFPQVNFVGMDYRFKRGFKLGKKLQRSWDRGEQNFRYLRARGERLAFIFGPGEVDRLFYFFPDPWPKRRQHKRRLFGRHFLSPLHQVLKPGGEVYIKTDHLNYAGQILQILEEQNLFGLEFLSHDLHRDFPRHFLSRYITKFEKIFLAQKKPITALVIKKL